MSQFEVQDSQVHHKKEVVAQCCKFDERCATYPVRFAYVVQRCACKQPATDKMIDAIASTPTNVPIPLAIHLLAVVLQKKWLCYRAGQP